jgi:NitT/TauT family transport system substrate-binding protein
MTVNLCLMSRPYPTYVIRLLCAITAVLIATSGCERFDSTVNPVAAPVHGTMAVRNVSDSTPAPKRRYTLAVSIYAGWMPWYYANESGVLKRWADQQGIEIHVEYMDYIDSIEAFVAGKADACVMTNMEALDLPAAAGIDTSIVIVGDYSNGNDRILTRGIPSVAALKGSQISLVELSVSDYMLSRALEAAGLSADDIKLLNVGDDKIGPTFLANKTQKAVVTWNPIAMEIQKEPGIICIYDSSKIPGEILDLCAVRTTLMKTDPRLAKALVGAWYEVLGVMQQHNAKSQAVLAKMASLAGCSLADYQAQLKTTFMFWEPATAVQYAHSIELKTTMDSVRHFCFAKKLLGDSSRSVDDVAIAYPGGAIQGDPAKVKLRFDTSLMEAAAQ